MTIESPRGPTGRLPRLVGRIFFTAGFLLALFGLTQHDRFLINASLGLLVSGIIATGVGLYQHVVFRKSDRP